MTFHLHRYNRYLFKNHIFQLPVVGTLKLCSDDGITKYIPVDPL